MARTVSQTPTGIITAITSTKDQTVHSLRTASPQTEHRIEHDCVGSLPVPSQAYWGIHTQRAIENFPVSGIAVSHHPELIHAYATVKRACAMANRDLGGITKDQWNLIDSACTDVASGAFDDQFPTDVLQGGAGTSTNMNVNEVIANRALELGGYEKGSYTLIHPNDHVNKSQSTNDSYPAAARLAIIEALNGLLKSMGMLSRAFRALGERTMQDVTIGRTQLQDAVPMTFGQEFSAFASLLESDAKAIHAERSPLATLNLGGTAIGTGICADARFRKCSIQHAASLTGLPITAADDPIAATSDTADFVMTSALLKRSATHLGKIANDLRLLSSGPRAGIAEIMLPPRQAGSSIMPGKVNPVIPECVNQSVFMVMGMDTTVSFAAEAGQLQLNAFEPVIVHAILESIGILGKAMDTLRINCVEGIRVNAETAEDSTRRCASLATSLIGHIGYEQAVGVAQTAMSQNITVREAAGLEGSIRPEILDDILNPLELARVQDKG
ncbi:MAG: aspartate ammonia-lyase [Bifidobacterium psychraerophilum]|jgi:aspartate ammonia-lyase|uniref:aspartate ammonia-lyase n=1 Tax=Bifidobacterium psychraerophilum TaxID=218140 RepID=UPI0039ECFBE1